MKDATVSSLLESGEIQMTEDVSFMIDTILSMIERGMGSPSGSNLIGLAMHLLETWRDSMGAGTEETEAADQVIENIMAGKL